MVTKEKKRELFELNSIRNNGEIYHDGQGIRFDFEKIRMDYPIVDIETLIRHLRSIWDDENHYGEYTVHHCLEHAITDYCKEKGICLTCGNIDIHDVDMNAFYGAIGIFVNTWGFLEGNIRTLHMMKEPDETFRSRLPNGDWYAQTDDGFMNRVASVFPEKKFPSTHTQLADVAEFRNFVTHNLVLKYCDGTVNFVHFDRYASEKAQHSISCVGESRQYGDDRVFVLKDVVSRTRDIRKFNRYLETLIEVISETHPCESVRLLSFDLTSERTFLVVWRSCESHGSTGHQVYGQLDDNEILIGYPGVR